MTQVYINTLYPEVKDYYTIDEFGNVYSDYSKRLLKPCINNNNSNNIYYRVSLQRLDGTTNRYAIHRMLMMAFKPIPNMEKYQVNHIDGNKLNNNLNNLEWVTCKENIRHAWKNSLAHTRTKEKSNFSKLQEKDIIKIFELRNKGYTQQQIADKLKICTRSNISYILNKKTWSK